MPHSTFESFFAARYGPLVRHLYLSTGQLERAQDCAQEAFVRAWQRWDRLANDDPIGWVQTVAWRLAVSEWRSSRRRHNRLVKHGPIPDVEPPSEDAVAVAQALERVSPDHRAVLVLHYFADLEVAAIADLLRLPPGTVKSRLSRAREAMDTALGPIR